MKERDLQTLFTKHLRENPPLQTTVYELKLAKTKSIRFDTVKHHQLLGLLNAKSTGIFHKLTDMPHFPGSKVRFDIKKPFDCFYIKNAEAYVGICFYEPRKPKVLILIDVENYLEFINQSPKKSFTEAEALFFASHMIKLKNKYGSREDS